MNVRIRDLSGIRIERVEFPSSQGTVRGLYYQAAAPAQTCVVLAHGYSSSKHNLDPLAFYLATEGMSALALDFQGHKLGCSTLPLVSPDDLCRNVVDAVVYSRNVCGAQTVVAAGHSMGAAAVIGAALQTDSIHAAIVMCTALSRGNALDNSGLLGGLRNRACYVDGPPPQVLTKAMDGFTQKISALSPRPVLVVAASKDAIVSPSAVRELFEAAGEPRHFELIDATHTDAAERAKFVVLRWLRARGFSHSQSNA